jgi:hypothetical protein
MFCYDVISREVALGPRSNNTQYSASKRVKKHVLYIGLCDLPQTIIVPRLVQQPKRAQCLTHLPCPPTHAELVSVLLLAFPLFSLVAALSQCLFSESPYLSIKLYSIYVKLYTGWQQLGEATLRKLGIRGWIQNIPDLRCKNHKTRHKVYRPLSPSK